MAELGGLGGLHPRANGVAADFFEGAADAGGIAGELHGGGVGQKLALAGDGGLNQTAEKIADVAQCDHDQADGEDDDDQPATVFVAVAGADAHVAHAAEDSASDQADD